MAEQSTEKLRIRLHVYDTDMPVNIRPQDEPRCRQSDNEDYEHLCRAI